MEDILSDHLRQHLIFLALLDLQDIFLKNVMGLVGFGLESLREIIAMDEVVDYVLQFLETPSDLERVISLVLLFLGIQFLDKGLSLLLTFLQRLRSLLLVSDDDINHVLDLLFAFNQSPQILGKESLLLTE